MTVICFWWALSNVSGDFNRGFIKISSNMLGLVSPNEVGDITVLTKKNVVLVTFSTSVTSWDKKNAKQKMSSYISILVANGCISTKPSVQVLHSVALA